MIEEGKAKIFTVINKDYKGPGKKSAGFYNPTWHLDRDIQILFCRHIYQQGARKFLDGMAATGIRGIRIKKEISKDISIDINDVSKKSYEIILKNVKENGIEATILNEKFCNLVSRKKYDYIDLDPYGSPSPYIPCIFEGLKKKGFISISATDVATLSGVFKKTCMRRYLANPLKMQGAKEIGLRILLGYIARIAGIFDYSFKPMLSYHYAHYFRVYGSIEKGVKKAEKSLACVGQFYWENGWKIGKSLNAKKIAGPLWTGKLHDKNFIKILESSENKKIKEMAKKFMEEDAISLPYYESGKIAKEIKTRQPSLDKLIEKLRRHGWKAARTHFAGNAFKTNAGYDEIKSYF